MNDCAAVPPNDTDVAPEKLEPVIITELPLDAQTVVGEKDVIVGGADGST